MKVKSDLRSKFSNLSPDFFRLRLSNCLNCKIRWSPAFFRLCLSNCLNWKIYCEDHSSLSSTTAVQIWIISYINFTLFHCTGKYELIKLTSLPMCGFIAQLVEHRTGIAEVTGSNLVEALIFSGFIFPIASIGKLTAMIILHFHLQPQFKYELFYQLYFRPFHSSREIWTQ